MFLETVRDSSCHRGWIEVITGSMFSGKTEELLRRLKRAMIAQQKVEIFKPEIDKRYSDKKVVSHDSNSIPSIPVSHSSHILPLTREVDVIGIDEAQFFDVGIVDICKYLANNGIRVIVAGLDTDFRGEPFGAMPALLATAEYVTKVHAICMRCGNIANFSHRKSHNSTIVLLGEKETYEPLCRVCYCKIENSSDKELYHNSFSESDKV